jgi:hypothetical protein
MRHQNKRYYLQAFVHSLTRRYYVQSFVASTDYA